MYTPPAFRLQDRDLALQVVEENPFGMLAALIGGGDRGVGETGVGEIEITHIPMQVSADGEALRVIGHVARGNPLVRAFEAGAVGTAVFSGPHAYISPDWYAAEDQVPTWNYVAVHFKGRLTPITDPEALRGLLSELVASQETVLAPKRPWDHTMMPDGLMDRMMKGIVGFSMAVATIEAKAKMAQNKRPEDRDGAIGGLTARGDPGSVATAEWMRRLAR
jgi:transcriptional regulator